MKFKIGDTIKAIKYSHVNDKHLYQLEKEYIVRGRGILKDCVTIVEENGLKGHCCSPSEDCFELVKAKELTEIEKKFYKLYETYEKLFIECYPYKIHPYEQNAIGYVEPKENMEEKDIQRLQTEIDKLKTKIKNDKLTKRNMPIMKQKLIKLFRQELSKATSYSMYSDKSNADIMKYITNCGTTYYIRLKKIATNCRNAFLYLRVESDRSCIELIDNKIALSQKESNELIKLFDTKVDKIIKKPEIDHILDTYKIK